MQTISRKGQLVVERRKVSAVHSEFKMEIDRLLRLDQQNQKRFHIGPGRPSSTRFSKSQMTLITEGVFMRAFSAYESFLEDVFLLYARGKPTVSGQTISSFLNPKSTSHARDMIKSNMTFLEWNSPDNVIKRSEIYLGDSNPIKQAVTTNLSRLQYIRKIRNAITHRSIEARNTYIPVVRTELRALPLKVPEPGEFLNTSDPRTPNSYFLVIYLDMLKSVAYLATH